MRDVELKTAIHGRGCKVRDVELKKTLRGNWDSYRKHVMPRYIGDTQLTETRQAFYAGAGVVIEMLQEVARLELRRFMEEG